MIRFIDSVTGAVTGNDKTPIAINGTSLEVGSITGAAYLPSLSNFYQYFVSGRNALWVYAEFCVGCSTAPLFQLFCGIPSSTPSLTSSIDGTCDVATFSNLLSFASGVGDKGEDTQGSFNFGCSFFVADGFSIRCVSFSSNITGQVSTLYSYTAARGFDSPLAFLAIGGNFKVDCVGSGLGNLVINRPSYIFGYQDGRFSWAGPYRIYGFGALGLPQVILDSIDSIRGITVDFSGNVFFSSGFFDVLKPIADVFMFDTAGVLTKIASDLRCNPCPMTVNSFTKEVFVSTLDGIFALSPSNPESSSSLLTPLNIALISAVVFLSCTSIYLFVLLYWGRASKLALGSDLEMTGILSPSKKYALMSS